jgi:hypothetical protein
MKIDPQQAATALDEIAGAERRTRQSLGYADASASLILWGVLVIIGCLVEFAWPRQAGISWMVLNGVGLVGTVLLVRLGRSRDCGDDRGTRILYSLLVLTGFGLIWSLVIGGFSSRQLAVFWPTLFMCGYVIGGIWLGRFFIVLGVSCWRAGSGCAGWAEPCRRTR